MDFKWATKQMENGRKVRRPCWRDGTYYYYEGCLIKIFEKDRCTNDKIRLQPEDVTGTDWELFYKKIDTNVGTVGNLIEVLQKLDEDMRVETKKTYCVHVSVTGDRVLIGDYR